VFTPVERERVVYVGGPPEKRGRGLLFGWKWWLLIVVVALIAVQTIVPKSLDNAQLTGDATWDGYDCPEYVWECWPIWDWDVSTFKSLEARFSLTMQPGAKLYARWECSGVYYGVVQFSNSTSTESGPWSINRNVAPAVEVSFVAGNQGRSCSFHLWSDVAASGKFKVTNARFITSTGVPSASGASFPAATAVQQTFCSIPLPTNVYGPPAPTSCVPTPTATPVPGPCDGHYWCQDVVVTIADDYDHTGITGYTGPVTMVAGDVYSYGVTHVGASGSGTYELRDRLNADVSGPNGCTVSAVSGDSPAFNFGNGDWEWLGVGVTRTHTGTFILPASSSSCKGLASGTSGTFNLGHACANCGDSSRTAHIIFWIDPSGWVAPTSPPSSLPPNGPAEPSDPPTEPPNQNGGGGGQAFPSRFDANICPKPRPSPEIAACAPVTPAPTAVPTYGPQRTPLPSGGGEDGTPGNFGNGNGGECDSSDELPTKVGYVAFLSVTELGDFGARVANKSWADWLVAALGFVGDFLMTLPSRLVNGLIWVWDAGVNAIIPGSCLEGIWDEFADQANDHVPFSYVVQGSEWLIDGFSDTGADTLDWSFNLPTPLGGTAHVDIGDWWAVLVDAAAPFRSVIGAFAYIVMIIRIMITGAQIIKVRAEPKQLGLGL